MHSTTRDAPEEIQPIKLEAIPQSPQFDDLVEKRRQKAIQRRAANPHFPVWLQWGLQLADAGGPIQNLRNAVSVLENDSRYKGTIWFDEFLNRILTGEGRDWRDADDIALALHIQGEIGITRMSPETVHQAVISAAYENRRNCVQDWITGLEHDGTPRIAKFFSDYMGADENDYVAAASKNFWLSLAARAMRPGCKVDNMIVLEGNQGVGKSRALQIIGGDWFAEQHESATNPKAFAEILQGKLLVEISEMDAFNRAEVNRVKQTVSCASDRFRASYARYASDHPRTCVFVGTTNRDDWNRDETGARRFWPIACNGSILLDGIHDNREQLFAEALVRLNAEEDYWTMPHESTRAEQDRRFQQDPWHWRVVELLRGKNEVTCTQILEDLGIELSRRGRPEQMRVASILRKLHLHKRRKTVNDQREYIYEAAPHYPD